MVLNITKYMIKKYQNFNNIVGWFVFLIASSVYLLTIEPSASFWDCGEYIATSYKLQVGHPPGAPTFQLISRLFTIFAFDNLQKVSVLVNSMSALASGFTILFLFWSITAIAKKIILKNENDYTLSNIMAVMGAGIVGGLAYTFSDTAWFSAEEGEVYALSSFFTAIVFWAILKWESIVDNDKYADRWIVFIAFLMGLSVGVHLLNLLTIPAISYVYYFKKYKPTRKGFIITGMLSLVILVLVQNIIIPKIPSFLADFEVFFVNVFSLPFNSGTIIFFSLLIGAILFGIHQSIRRQNHILNLSMMSLVAILIGYSTFAILVIRSQADTPINENEPKNAVSLLSYLNREQYGDWPILYGQYYNAPLDPTNPYKDGNPVYGKDEASGKYIVIDSRKSSIPNYDKRFCTFFPRMWSQQKNHISGYKSWGKIEGIPMQMGNGEVDNLPTFSENLRFFFRYQLGHMYFRYFMWNFSGRQNDTQGHGGIREGNWITGIQFIDEMRLGPQSKLPEAEANNKGKNKYYMFPLILGIIGLIYNYTKKKDYFFIVFLLFIMTGIAINMYLNPVPFQPRERDYAYVGSFYAFAIWIGLGVLALYDYIGKRVNGNIRAIGITSLCLFTVPYIMAKENWNDHDRSNRYTVIDFATNYLETCDKNGIIFTNGDNDTFPLWYAQEVEGVRTDVRVINLSLFNTDWYINQKRKKAYDSNPVEFSLTPDKYLQGKNDVVFFYERDQFKNDTVPVSDIIKFIASSNPDTKIMRGDQTYAYVPTRNFRIPVDSFAVFNNGILNPKDLIKINPLYNKEGKVIAYDTTYNKIVNNIDWAFPGNMLMKNSLLVLDLLSSNNWKRPIYFATTTGSEGYLGLTDYFMAEGLAYKLVPIYNKTVSQGDIGLVNTEKMYDNLMNKYKWGNMNRTDVYLDETNMRMTMNFRLLFGRLANELVNEGKKEKAIKVLDKCIEIMPNDAIPYNYFMLSLVEAYYRADAFEKGNALNNKLADIYEKEIVYFKQFNGEYQQSVQEDLQRSFAVLAQLGRLANGYNQTKLGKELDDRLNKYYTGKR